MLAINSRRRLRSPFIYLPSPGDLAIYGSHCTSKSVHHGSYIAHSFLQLWKTLCGWLLFFPESVVSITHFVSDTSQTL